MFFFFSPQDKSGNGRILDDYTLYDKFTTTVAAGSVNATTAEPVGGARTVTDTNSKISITGGVLSFATGGATNDGAWYPIVARVLGRTAITRLVLADTNGRFSFGFDSDQAGGRLDNLNSSTTAIQVSINGSSSIVIGAISATTYNLAMIMRSSGMFHLIKGGVYTNWTLLYMSVAGNASAYPGIGILNTTSVFTADNVRVPKRLYIPVPLQSDGMSVATTDGAGNAEANGPVGNVYTNVGTWGVAGGVRSCSALTGSGFSYLPCTSSNVIIDAVCTRSVGVTGIVARYASATDYLIAYLDGTNAKLDKVVGGVTTNLISAAVTYGAAFVLRLVLDGTSARLFYNNLAVGSLVTAPSSTSLNHGLYTTDTGATFDNLIIWARGNEGQYSGLDSL